jgi:putative two-component system response regulator
VTDRAAAEPAARRVALVEREGGPAGGCAEGGDAEARRLRVMVADDDPAVRTVLDRMMSRAGFRVLTVADGAQALDAVQEWRTDVMLLDGIMPGVDGFEVCRRVKADPRTMLLPVIMVTGLDSRADRVRGVEVGADGFLSKPFSRVDLLARVRMLGRMKQATDRLERAAAVLVAMARSIEGKDPDTHGHCDRLSDYSTRLARRLGLDGAAQEALWLGGIVHDIGKVAIHDAILAKPGAVDETEWGVMRNHPLEGERICGGLSSFRDVLPIIRHHHEKMDGTGYPDGLAGDAIPVTARVLQLVDVYDALTTARPYKQAVQRDAAVAIMEGEVERGWWDPKIFAEFRRLVLDDRCVTDGATARVH